MGRIQAASANLFPATVKIGPQSYACGTSGLERGYEEGDGPGQAVRRVSFWLQVTQFTAAGQPLPQSKRKVLERRSLPASSASRSIPRECASPCTARRIPSAPCHGANHGPAPGAPVPRPLRRRPWTGVAGETLHAERGPSRGSRRRPPPLHHLRWIGHRPVSVPSRSPLGGPLHVPRGIQHRYERSRGSRAIEQLAETARQIIKGDTVQSIAGFQYLHFERESDERGHDGPVRTISLGYEMRAVAA